MDLVIRNAKVWTVDDRRPTAEAVGVRGGRIAAVGDDREVRDAVGADAEELDARGNTVLPGFIDAHNHLRTGADADAVQLGDATTLDAVGAAIDRHATEHPDREWIVAEDWSYAALPDRRRPTAEDLDGVAPGRALMVFSYDVHNVWLNREAMRRFGIGAGGRTLAFGRPELDASTGEPTGFVTDFAVMGLSRDGQTALAAQVPNFAPDEMYRRLLRSLDMAAELGITTAVEPQNSLDDLPLFRKARDEGAMRSRVVAALFHPPGTTSEELDAFAEAKAANDDDRFRVGPIKLYIDDVIEPHTAAMLTPYANRPDTSGDTFYPPDVFAELITALERRGFQTFTHATGDRGIRTALDAVQHARRVNGPRDARHQIVHGECVHPDDLPRFAELGVVACSNRATARRGSSKTGGRTSARNAGDTPGRSARSASTARRSRSPRTGTSPRWIPSCGSTPPARARTSMDPRVDAGGDDRSAQGDPRGDPRLGVRELRRGRPGLDRDREARGSGHPVARRIRGRASGAPGDVGGRDDRGRGGGLPAMSATWEEFERLRTTVGVVTEVEDFPKPGSG